MLVIKLPKINPSYEIKPLDSPAHPLSLTQKKREPHHIWIRTHDLIFCCAINNLIIFLSYNCGKMEAMQMVELMSPLLIMPSTCNPMQNIQGKFHRVSASLMAYRSSQRVL